MPALSDDDQSGRRKDSSHGSTRESRAMVCLPNPSRDAGLKGCLRTSEYHIGIDLDQISRDGKSSALIWTKFPETRSRRHPEGRGA